MGRGESKREKKERRWADLQDACCKYNKILFVDADNVTSKQISIMRKTMRGMDAKMIMGKNVGKRAQSLIITIDAYEESTTPARHQARRGR